MSWNTKIPKFRRFVLQNFPFIEEDFDALTDYELICKVVEYLNTVIQSQNELITETERFETSVTNEINTFESNITSDFEELEGLFNTLKNYVDNYFDNLDVQEEIDHKLDEMVEDGTLQEIITTYIQTNVAWTFDTVADMKLATNLINGSYARTLGFYALDDGGGGIYKITNTGVANELDLIAVNNSLLAELVITKNMTVKQFGAKGDGLNDDLGAINRMIARCNYLHIPAGNYLISNPLSFAQFRDINIKGKLIYAGNDYAITFTGGNYLDVYIKSIEASNGGCIKIAPTTNAFAFSKINLEFGEASSHVIEMDGDGNAICNTFLKGIRWRSTASTACNITMTNQASANSFVNEIVIRDVNLWTKAKERAGLSTNNTSTKEIQIKLETVNFENSWGIHTLGKIIDIAMINCRIGEIKNDPGWLTFDGYLPKISIMGVGDNYLNLNYIELDNISSTTAPYLVTNLTIQDYETTYLFAGGGVGYLDHVVPFVVPDATKTYETTGNISYSDLSKGGGNYNRFNFTGNGWISFTIPTNLFYCTQNSVLITTTYSISLTVILSTGGSVTFQTDANSTYMLKKVGNSIKYIKLS